MTELSSFLSTFTNVLLAAFGIGLLIFVHEAGHFLCARWIGARVEVFSLGFGPRLLGWRRGATDYRVSLVPLGGYVQVAGQDPGDRRYPASQCLWSKGTGQRMLFFSGGVVMNLLFALVAFPVVFHAGVDFVAPVVGAVAPGSAAWEIDLQPGDRILDVNGKRIYSFEVLAVEVALAGSRGVKLVVKRAADGREETLSVATHYNQASGTYDLGIDPATDGKPPTVQVRSDGPAYAAGLRNGDRLLRIDGQPGDLLAASQAMTTGKPVRFEAAGDDGTREVTVTPTLQSTKARPMIGVSPLAREVAGLRPGLPLLQRLDLRRGDLVLGVDGRALDAAGLRAATGGDLRIDVLRGEQLLRLTAPNVDADQLQSLCEHVALVAATGELTLDPRPDTPAARAGMLAGDRLLAIDGQPVDSWDQLSSMVKSSRPGAQLRFKLLRTTTAVLQGDPAACWDPRGIPLRADTVELQLQPESAMQYDFGMDVTVKKQLEQFRTDGFFAAMQASLVCSVDLIKQLCVTLKRMFTGDVAAKNLGGIITISRISYQNAAWGPSQLFYFLALLSINLAFINVLPIPVLDGGHLLFLLIERIKGSPVSTSVMNYSQILGLIFVLALVVFVTYNDILRIL